MPAPRPWGAGSAASRSIVGARIQLALFDKSMNLSKSMPGEDTAGIHANIARASMRAPVTHDTTLH